MAAQPFTTPVLFLIFNRPETTEKVFRRIRDIQPRQLFISADGPHQHNNGEDRRCAETRKIIEKIDWKCELKTNFSKKNLGCRMGVSSGIDWFFRHVSEGIIIEDDCLPDLSFFHFCQSLLAHYRDDTRIMHIGGTNLQDGIIRGSGSYYFSNINHVWGWATWKRAWNLYDVDMKSYPQCLQEDKLTQLISEPAFRKYWKRNFDLVYEQRKDTWDYQWQYATFLNKGLAIIPNKNLVSNIGFDHNATHTVDIFHSLSNRPTERLDDLVHPSFVQIEQKADSYIIKKYLSPPRWKKLLYLIARYFRYIS